MDHNKIMIKKADKVWNVAIQNKDDYILEGLWQLNDKKFHLEVDRDLTLKQREKVQQVIGNMMDIGEISDNTYAYLSMADYSIEDYSVQETYTYWPVPPVRQ